MLNQSVQKQSRLSNAPQKRERLDKLTEREARESVREALTSSAPVYLQQFEAEVR
jgi:hypothetical protein